MIHIILTNVKIKINDSFSPYVKGFYYYGLSNYYKDSFYSIFLIESILRVIICSSQTYNFI